MSASASGVWAESDSQHAIQAAAGEALMRSSDNKKSVLSNQRQEASANQARADESSRQHERHDAQVCVHNKFQQLALYASSKVHTDVHATMYLLDVNTMTAVVTLALCGILALAAVLLTLHQDG
eukprot:20654-Heterococcus_DN1.PRE.1